MAACGQYNAAIKNAAFVATLAIIYMSVSTGLITFNKRLMHPDCFPYAIGIGLLHMTSSLGFNAVLLWICPSLYPSLTDPEQRVTLDSCLFTRILIPIATCFAAQVCLSNMAFMHSSVSMLQMMKQANVVLVYCFSLALSLENFCKKRAITLLVICGATALTIHGEMHFSFNGFALQGISMFCESLKLTFQSHSLSATGARLDAFTYVMLVAPLVLAVLTVWLILFSLLWPNRPEVLTFPPLQPIVDHRWLLFGNGVLAFAMQIAHAAFMKNSSAITFILTGVVMKDIAIVAVCAMFFGEELSPQQVIGFSLQLIGALVWSFLKAQPSSSPPPLPRGATGLIAAAHPAECEALKSSLMKEDQFPDTFKRVRSAAKKNSIMRLEDEAYGEEGPQISEI